MAGNIHIIEPTENYQKVSKSIIFNEDVDALTLGVYVKVLCLGKKWELNVPGLAKILNLSEAKIKAAFSILERAGYVKRIHIKDDATGHFLGYDYHIGSEPFPEEERTDLVASCGPKNSSHPKTQRLENPTAGKPSGWNSQRLENRTDINRDNKEDRDNTQRQRQQQNITIPPPFQEVVKYCRERGFADPEGFADYYLENQKQGGWKRKDGKAITNWKQNVLQWERYNKNKTFPRTTNKQTISVQQAKSKYGL